MIKTIPDHFYRIPWKTGGRDQRGADCWGFVRLVALEVFDKSMPLLDENYESIDNRKLLEDLIFQNSRHFKRVVDPEPGDILLFRIIGHNSHVGIMLNNNDFAHMWHSAGVCVERFTGAQWLNRLQGFFRYEK